MHRFFSGLLSSLLFCSAAAITRPVFLRALVEGGEVGVQLLDDLALHSMNLSSDFLETFLTPDINAYLERTGKRVPEGEEIALLLLTPMSSGAIVLNPVKVGENAMEKLVSKGKAFAEDVSASNPFLEILPGAIARIKQTMNGGPGAPELLPLLTEEAIHSTLEAAFNSFLDGAFTAADFFDSAFKITPLGRLISDITTTTAATS